VGTYFDISCAKCEHTLDLVKYSGVNGARVTCDHYELLTFVQTHCVCGPVLFVSLCDDTDDLKELYNIQKLQMLQFDEMITLESARKITEELKLVKSSVKTLLSIIDRKTVIEALKGQSASMHKWYLKIIEEINEEEYRRNFGK
jgi:hypothetical protein